MRFSAFSVLMSFTVLTLIGVGLVSRLSLRFLPVTQTPSVSVQYAWPEASPEVIEQEVTTPLEGTFSLIKGVRKIYSVSGNGNGNIRLDFDKNAPLDYLRFEIASKVRQLYPNLPEGLRYPTIQVNQPDEEQEERPLLVYSLSGNDSPTTLYRYALERLNPQLALTGGIRSIQVTGGNELEWLISYDARQLEALRLQPAQLSEAIRQHFQSEALGIISQGTHDIFIQLRNHKNEDTLNEENWQHIVISSLGGRIFRLGDVAKIQLSERPPRQHYRINGQNSVRLIFFPERHVNTIQLAQDIKSSIATLTQGMPASYRLHLEDDSTEYLREELHKIRERTLLSLSVLLVFILLVYRSFRYLMVILFSLIANLGLAFIFYYLFKVDIHLYALAGITVSFGMVIDNTIVMAHHLRTQGNMHVFPALLAATLTTISALIIIFFLPDLWKANLLDFAKVIIINLSVSLVIATLLVPALLEKITLTAAKTKRVNFSQKRRQLIVISLYKKMLSWLCRYRSVVIIATILLFGLPVFLLPNKIENRELYNKTLGSDWYVDHMKPVVNKLLGGTLRLFTQYVYEGSAYREPDETILYIQGSMPPGATLEQMNAVFWQVEKYLAQFDIEIKQFTTQVSSGQFGMTQVYFNPGYDLSFPYILRSRMIAYSINLGGVKWNIYGVGRGFSNDNSGAPPRFRVMMYGYDKNELERQANRFAEKLLVHPRIQEVNINANINWWEKDLYQYEMSVNSQALAQMNIPLLYVSNSLQSFNRVTTVSLSTLDGTVIRLMDHDVINNDLWLLQNKTLRTSDSTSYNFSNIGIIEKKKASNSLHKENQQYIRMVEFEYTGSAQFGSKYLKQCMEEMRLEMPLGYTMEETNWRTRRESRKLYGLLLLVTGLIFFICSIQFESLRQALAIILLIPVSFIGIFLTFYWFDIYFDQGGYTSFVVVSGLVVNSLIFILNDFNGFRSKQPSRSDITLYAKAFYHKIVPILLTVFSTSLGLVPFLTVGNQDVFWYALASGVIGGLLFSVLVITIICPVIICKHDGKP